jgi:steroid delta-isomerase-like uncharacterized protein
MASTSELLDLFVELFNSNRIGEFEKYFASGGYGEEIGTNRRLTPQENTANAQGWRQAFPDARGKITSKVVDGAKGAAELVWTGTNTGPLMGQPPTGKKVSVRAAAFIETNGTQIVRSAHYIDVAGMMAQLKG